MVGLVFPVNNDRRRTDVTFDGLFQISMFV